MLLGIALVIVAGLLWFNVIGLGPALVYVQAQASQQTYVGTLYWSYSSCPPGTSCPPTFWIVLGNGANYDLMFGATNCQTFPVIGGGSTTVCMTAQQPVIGNGMVSGTATVSVTGSLVTPSSQPQSYNGDLYVSSLSYIVASASCGQNGLYCPAVVSSTVSSPPSSTGFLGTSFNPTDPLTIILLVVVFVIGYIIATKRK